MKIRWAFFFFLIILSAAVIWIVTRRTTAPQEMSISPFIDRGTEVLQALDHLGQQAAKLSVEEEMEVGKQIVERFCRRITVSGEDTEVQIYLNGIMETLLTSSRRFRPEMSYQIRHIEMQQINAFALPGGYLFVTAGLVDLAANESEVAAVIGHEMAHVDLGHCAARVQYGALAKKVGGELAKELVQVGYDFLTIGYSDEQEEEADRQGSRMVYEAKYHPHAALVIHNRMADALGRNQKRPDHLDQEIANLIETALEDYFSSHPPAHVRLASLKRSFREQKFDLTQRLYLGTRNHQTLVPRSVESFDDEWVFGPLDD